MLVHALLPHGPVQVYIVGAPPAGGFTLFVYTG
jgi:hypothetical protein